MLQPRSDNRNNARTGHDDQSTTLDEATAKLQGEVDEYDAKIRLLRSHVGSLLRNSIPVPLPPGTSLLTESENGAHTESKEGAPTTLPSSSDWIVRGVVTASGQGCKEVVASSAARNVRSAFRAAAVLWKTRGYRKGGRATESFCTLLLASESNRDVAIHITFTEASTVPASISFEHATSPTAPFSLLGKVDLEEKSTTQLKHVFRLGEDIHVGRCLRITCLGHVLGHEKASQPLHSVQFLAITGLKGWKRSKDILQQPKKADKNSPLESSPRSDQHSAVGCFTGTLQQEEEDPKDLKKGGEPHAILQHTPSASVLLQDSAPTLNKISQDKEKEVKDERTDKAPYQPLPKAEVDIMKENNGDVEEGTASSVKCQLEQSPEKRQEEEEEEVDIGNGRLNPNNKPQLNTDHSLDMSALEKALRSELEKTVDKDEKTNDMGQLLLRAIQMAAHHIGHLKDVDDNDAHGTSKQKPCSQEKGEDNLSNIPPTAENSSDKGNAEVLSDIERENENEEEAGGCECEEDVVSHPLDTEEEEVTANQPIHHNGDNEDGNHFSSPVARILTSAKSLVESVRASATYNGAKTMDMDMCTEGEERIANDAAENAKDDYVDQETMRESENPLVAVSSWHQIGDTTQVDADGNTSRKSSLLQSTDDLLLVRRSGKGKRVSFSLPSSPVSRRDCGAEWGMHVSNPSVAEEGFERLNNISNNNNNTTSLAAADSPLIDVVLAKKLVRRAEKVRKSWEKISRSKDDFSIDLRTSSASLRELRKHQKDLSDGFMLQGRPFSFHTQEVDVDVEKKVDVEKDSNVAVSQVEEERVKNPLQPIEDMGVTKPVLGYSSNMDAFIAEIIANAGNTPTGPLARGARQGPADLFYGEEVEALRKEVKERHKTKAMAANTQRKALLEPLVPAPLGMGVAVYGKKQDNPSTTTSTTTTSAAATVVAAITAKASGRTMSEQNSGKATVDQKSMITKKTGDTWQSFRHSDSYKTHPSSLVSERLARWSNSR